MEALWQMRKLSGNPDKVFEALQYNLPQIGYKLSSSLLARVGIAVNSRVGYIVKKIRNISGGNERRAVRSRFWCTKSLIDSTYFNEANTTRARNNEASYLLLPWEQLTIFMPHFANFGTVSTCRERQ